MTIGIFNRYCGTLLFIMLVFLLIGVRLTYEATLTNYIPYALGGFISLAIVGLMALGFKMLSPSPRQIGLITCFGVKTSCKVEGLVLLFKPFGWKIIDVVTFSMVYEDIDIPIGEVTCIDGGVIKGIASISVIADASSGAKLKRFDDIGQVKGFVTQIDDILLSGTQALAKAQTTDYMVRNSTEIGVELRRMVEGKNIGDTDESDDIRGLGAVLDKFQVKFFKDPLVVRMDQKALVTELMNHQIKQRVDLYKARGEAVPSIKQLREEILEEQRHAENLVKEIRGGGINVNNT